MHSIVTNLSEVTYRLYSLKSYLALNLNSFCENEYIYFIITMLLYPAKFIPCISCYIDSRM